MRGQGVDRVAVGALTVAWAAVFVQAVTGVGVDFPTFPPALIILGVAIALVVLVPRWWGPTAGAVPPLFIVVGAFIAPQARDQLTDPGQVDVFVGTLEPLLGAALGVIAGVIAAVQNRRGRTVRR